MSEITKKTTVVDHEFKKPIFKPKVVNYDDEYGKIMNSPELRRGSENPNGYV